MLDKQKVHDWLNEPGNNFCAMPFTHMAIEADGAVRPCCMGEKFEGLNIRGKTAKEVFNDPIRQEFIKSSERNEQHPACHMCWNDPHSIRGKFSTTWTTLQFTNDVMNGMKPEANLKWFEIKAGNRCNLKCRICGVWNSSSWAKDDHKLKNANSEISFKQSEAYKYTQSCDWIDDPKFWNDVDQLESLEYLHFMGGEPFMVPEHFQLIERLVNDPNIDTSNTTIGYNTNGTYFPTNENFELYNKFKTVMFHLSVDDIGPRFEYERTLANWEKVRDNIVKFMKVRSDKIKIIIDPTIGIHNIFYVDKIKEEFNKLGFPLDLAQDHYVFSGENDCRVLPKEVKDVIVQKFKNDNSPWMCSIMEYLNSKDYDINYWKTFINTTEQLDKIRNENFKEIYKEYFKILEPHWNKDE